MGRPAISDEAAKHEFDALNTLLLVVILGLCVLSSYLIKKYKCYQLPESAATLLVCPRGCIICLHPNPEASIPFYSLLPR